MSSFEEKQEGLLAARDATELLISAMQGAIVISGRSTDNPQAQEVMVISAYCVALKAKFVDDPDALDMAATSMAVLLYDEAKRRGN